MFTPELAVAALRAMHQKYGSRIYGRYGFVDAFNPNTGWVDTDVIGINAGIILLSAENARSGNIWRWFMRNEEIPRAMRAVGLEPYGKGPRASRPQRAAGAKSSERFRASRSLRAGRPRSELISVAEDAIAPRIKRQRWQRNRMSSRSTFRRRRVRRQRWRNVGSDVAKTATCLNSYRSTKRTIRKIDCD